MNDFDRLLRDSLTSVQDAYAEERQRDRVEARARFIERYRRRRRMFTIGSVALAGAAVIAIGAVASGRIDLFSSGPSEVAGQPEGIEVRVETGRRPIDAGIRPGGVWVANAGGASLAHVDTETNEVINRINLSGSPQEVDVGEDAVWVAGFGRVTAIDPDTDEIIDSATVGSATETISISVGEGAVWAVVGNRALFRVDPVTFERLRIPAVKRPVDVAARDGAIWVLEKKRLLRLEPSTGAVVGEPIAVSSEQGDISAGGGVVWIANKSANTIVRINASTLQVSNIITVEGTYLDLAVTEEVVYVLSSAEGRGLLTALDPIDGEPLGSPLEIRGEPIEVSVGGGGVWVVEREGGAILRVDPGRVTD